MSSDFFKRLEKDPFRLFFPLGALFAFAGILPWVIQYFTHASYPRNLHRVLMIDGFTLTVVCGFLMTSIPRFTGSNHAKRSEILTVFITLLISAVGAFFSTQSLSFLFSSFTLVSLLCFAGRRFLNKSSNPPYTFVFIGVGLILWLASNFILFLNSLSWTTSIASVEVAQELFSNGAIMCLILGVGGRLIPGILGWQEIVSEQRSVYETQNSFFKLIPVSIWIAVCAFVLSFFLIPFLPARLCLLARLAVLVFFGMKYWKLWRFPASRSFLTWNLWLSCWCLVLGYLFPLLWGGLGVHVMHVLFIGGFSLLMLLISTRVSLAHSPLGTAAEKTSRGLLVFSALVLTAMFTRVSAILWPQIYLDHLGFAAMTWIAALLVWVSVIFRSYRISWRRKG